MPLRTWRPTTVLLPLGVVAAVLPLLELLVRAGRLPDFLPAPSALWAAFSARPAVLADSMVPTLQKAAAGFAIAAALALSGAAVAAVATAAYAPIYNLGATLQSIPVIATTPLLATWLGTGPPTQIVIAVLASQFPMLAGAMQGFRAVDTRQRELFHTLSAGPVQRLRYLILPAAAGYVFAGFKVAAPAAVLDTITAEWAGAERGVGALMLNALFSYDPPMVWLSVIAACVLAGGGCGLWALGRGRADGGVLARAGPARAGPLHLEPPGHDAGGAASAAAPERRAHAPAGGQHGPALVRRGRSWSRFRSRSEWNTSGGEWLLGTHGAKVRRSWRKPHTGVDAGSGQIVAASLTAEEVDDGAEVGPLLDQITGVVASFTGDGGHDPDSVSAAVAERHPEAAVIVPPRATAVPSETAETAPTQRDRHLQHIAEHGRMARQRASGYTTRARAEAAIGRFKQVIGDGLRPRTDERRATEVDVAVHALKRMVELGRPNYVRTA